MSESLAAAAMAHVWQSTLVIGVVWLATLALRSNHARVRYWLWTAASVKFLVPFSWLVSVGEQLEWRTAPPIARPAATFVMDHILVPFVVAPMAASTPTTPSTVVWPWLLAAAWAGGFFVVLFWWWRQWRPVGTALRQATPIELGPEHDVCDLAV